LVFELEIEAALRARVPHCAEVSRFPAVRRDLAGVVDEQIAVQTLLDCVHGAAGDVLRRLAG
jgi:phenylalanyl-tRNA synthetase beta chain